MRLALLILALVCVLAFALTLHGPSASETRLDASREAVSVAAPLEAPCDSAQPRVELTSSHRTAVEVGTSDSIQTLAQEHGAYPFVPAALIVATIRDEAGHPIHDALVRGLRDAADGKPITASDSTGMIRLVADQPTASVVVSAPGYRSRRFENVADTDVLTLSRGVAIELQVPLSSAKAPPQRLHVILTPKGTLPWHRAPGTFDSWSGVDHDDGELMQAKPDFLRVFGKGEITGVLDTTGTVRVTVSDPGEYEVRIVLGTTTHIEWGYDLHGATDMEGLHEITPDPMPHITVGSNDEGRRYSIAL